MIFRSRLWLALSFLCLVWGLFFWRVWLPADQVSFSEGDFSHQFVVWTHYAAERLGAGELPLWNPYMYGGAPFQASSQTALFYPPRMLTLLSLLPQQDLQVWEVYAALQLEVMLHVLLASLFVFLFVWDLLGESENAALGGVVAGLSYAYGGYLGGYPILQVPLLEAGIWLPLVLWSISRATRGPQIRWRWMVNGGLFLGISLLAGHPQTSFFLIYLAVAWLFYRVYPQIGLGIRAMLILGGVAGILAAVQLLPTAEFTTQTYRTALSFEQKGGGYSFEELVNLLFPIRGEIWNSNHYGIVALVLAGLALWRGVAGWRFWAGAILLAGLLSFGARTPLYGLLYPVTPGLSLFRGQERATYVVAFSLAVLAGLGVAEVGRWASWRERPHSQTLRRAVLGLLAFSLLYTLVLYFLAQTDYRNATILGRMNGGALTSFLLLGWLWFLEKPQARLNALLLLLVFDLFSVTAMLKQNYESVPVAERFPPPPYHQVISLTGRLDSYGVWEGGFSLPQRWADVNGSDPLQLRASQFYLEQIPPDRRRELLAVEVVVEKADTPPPPDSLPLGTGIYKDMNIHFWELENPRPLAWPVYALTNVQNDAEAQGLVREPAFDLRHIAIIQGELKLSNPQIRVEEEHEVEWFRFEAEAMNFRVTVPREAVLTLSAMDFPHWKARINGETAQIYRAYGGLMALHLPAEGVYEIAIHYESPWLKLGGLISGLGWIFCGLFLLGGRKM